MNFLHESLMNLIIYYKKMYARSKVYSFYDYCAFYLSRNQEQNQWLARLLVPKAIWGEDLFGGIFAKGSLKVADWNTFCFSFLRHNSRPIYFFLDDGSCSDYFARFQILAYLQTAHIQKTFLSTCIFLGARNSSQSF